VASGEHTDYGREHDLTIDEVKACPMFAHFTDDEAEAVIETLKTFTKIIHDLHKKRLQNTRKYH
jgi:hypothetical protein